MLKNYGEAVREKLLGVDGSKAQENTKLDGSDNELVKQNSVRKSGLENGDEDSGEREVAANEQDIAQYVTSSYVSENTETKREGAETNRDDLEHDAWDQQKNGSDLHREGEVEAKASRGDGHGLEEAKDDGGKQNGGQNVGDEGGGNDTKAKAKGEKQEARKNGEKVDENRASKNNF